MPILNNAARNVKAQALVDAMAGATVEWRTAADAVLATMTMPTPAGTVASGVITWDLDPDLTDTIDASGLCAKAVMAGSGGAEVEFSVGTSGTDVIMANPDLVAGGTLTFQSLSTTVPAQPA